MRRPTLPDDERPRAPAAAAAALVATSVLKRSRLARVGVVGTAAGMAYRRLARRRPATWHDVPPGDAR